MCRVACRARVISVFSSLSNKCLFLTRILSRFLKRKKIQELLAESSFAFKNGGRRESRKSSRSSGTPPATATKQVQSFSTSSRKNDEKNSAKVILGIGDSNSSQMTKGTELGNMTMSSSNFISSGKLQETAIMKEEAKKEKTVGDSTDIEMAQIGAK